MFDLLDRYAVSIFRQELNGFLQWINILIGIYCFSLAFLVVNERDSIYMFFAKLCITNQHQTILIPFYRQIKPMFKMENSVNFIPKVLLLL